MKSNNIEYFSIENRTGDDVFLHVRNTIGRSSTFHLSDKKRIQIWKEHGQLPLKISYRLSFNDVPIQIPFGNDMETIALHPCGAIEYNEYQLEREIIYG